MTKSRRLPGAIVLGTGVNGLGVLRSLGRHGVSCGAVYNPVPGDQGIHSRYIKKRDAVPVSANDDQVMRSIERVCTDLGENRPVLIPTTDRFAQFLADNQMDLVKRFRLCCAESSLYDAFLDKWKTAAICNENDILIPVTQCPKSAEELGGACSELPFPVIVKPRYTFDKSFPGKNAVADTPDSLMRFYGSHTVLGSSVVQEIIPSGDGDIFVVATYSDMTGNVIDCYSGRKLRQLQPDYGATCFGISERHAELEKISISFLNSIGYRGFAALEFARSRADGRYYFLELNTRTYYHNQLFADAGKDLTALAYFHLIDVTGPRGSAVSSQRNGVVWIDFRRDFASMKLKRRKGQISILQWAISLPRARSFACWHWRDPMPFLIACGWRLGQILRRILGKR